MKISLEAISSDFEKLRSGYKILEKKLVESDNAKKVSDDLLVEKIQESEKFGAAQLKKQEKDAKTIKQLQDEIKNLKSELTKANNDSDLMNQEIFEPLGYNDEKRIQNPRDDLVQLAGEDVQDLISASQKIFYNLALKGSRTCDVRELINKMAILPDIVTGLQASFAHNAAQMALSMCLARFPDMDLNETTLAVLEDCDAVKMLKLCSDYDNRIVNHIHHDEFCDKVVLPKDAEREERNLKQKSAKAPAGSNEDSSVFTWTSSKSEGKANIARDTAASSPTEEAEK